MGVQAPPSSWYSTTPRPDAPPSAANVSVTGPVFQPAAFAAGSAPLTVTGGGGVASIFTVNVLCGVSSLPALSSDQYVMVKSPSAESCGLRGGGVRLLLADR